ncbi:hypothetical protein CAPTEDRAFT_107807 [Capitella teleta]|uniref:protein-tyrosine-phosphatase n=1 Tax=Capitella teleta TaxID=283909 RepID=R7UER9_CAPTE|nr:hypothetical protein CAPTEDRAFT_107807 [Capitella teleta]|eukprot:ELU01777.1 hypothetical protein CAPTEDRAFT_107807 [Capitella teleta]
MTEDDEYHTAILDILIQAPHGHQQTGPTQLLEHLFIGGYKDAEDVTTLSRMRITHVLNCAAFRKSDANFYPESSGIRCYHQFYARDRHDYDILDQHFYEAKSFIDDAKLSGGRCLVHCALGVNRSGVLCIAYIMLEARLGLLEAVKLVKERRGRVLANRGFQRQLIDFARSKGLLRSMDDLEL